MIENQKQKAESLFLNTEKTQQQIAAEIGISPRTLYRWIQQGRWQQLKSATRLMPSVLVENIYAQLDDINYCISQRDRGERHPTKDESLTINRLTNCIGKVQKQTSQGQNIEFLMNFINWTQTKNDDLAKLLTEYGSAYLNGSEVQGFHPYDIEYNNETTDLNNTTLSGACPATGGRGGRAEVSTGHDSDTQNQTQNPTQQIEDQPQTPENPNPEMSENIFPEDRTSLPEEAPPLFLGEVPEGGRGQFAPDNIHNQEPKPDKSTISPFDSSQSRSFSGRGQGDVGSSNEEPKPDKPTEDPPDFSDPNLLIKMHRREKGLPDEEETQLFSIGEKIFTMRIDKKKKRN